MPSNVPLTPEAAAVVTAFDLAMDIDDSTGLFECSRNALAAALRELVAVMQEAVPASAPTEWSDGYRDGLLRCISTTRLIADNIEHAITYAPPETPTNA